MKTTARIQTLRDALATIDKEIAEAEAVAIEKARRKCHAEAANLFVARLAEAKHLQAQVNDLASAVAPALEFHDRATIGFADAMIGSAADHVARPFAHAIDATIVTFERAIASLKNGDAFADDLARRALANQ